MNHEPMTPREVCRFALQFTHRPPARIIGWVKLECLPSFAKIAEAALATADGITPSDSTLAAHVFLHALAEWCDAQVGEAVPA